MNLPDLYSAATSRSTALDVYVVLIRVTTASGDMPASKLSSSTSSGRSTIMAIIQLLQYSFSLHGGIQIPDHMIAVAGNQFFDLANRKHSSAALMIATRSHNNWISLSR